MPKISPHLWFDNNAEEAMAFYVSVFPNSRILNVSRMEGVEGVTNGMILTGTCVLDGQEVMVLNGGPEFKFSEAFSFYIHCKDQQEVDYYWERLSAGGEPGPCGWLKDRFGLSWQIIPDQLESLLRHPDPAKARRVLEAMLKMGKLDVAALENA